MLVSNPKLVHYVSHTAANRERVNQELQEGLWAHCHDPVNYPRLYIENGVTSHVRGR